MRRIDQLITQVRRAAENDDVSATVGISTEEFVQYLNDAQTRLQSRILEEIPDLSLFDTSITVNLVAGQRSYSLETVSGVPVLGSMIRLVEYRSTSSEQDYYPLRRRGINEFSNIVLDYPTSYDIRNGAIYIDGIPGSSIGNFRITFPRALDSLDLRRGQVVTAVPVGSTYTTITLDSDPEPDSLLEDDDYYICVNDSFGTVTFQAVPISSYDVNTRVMTIFTPPSTSDGSITAGNWVTVGKYSTTHSKLPNECERYLIAYAVWKIMKRDSSDDAPPQESELGAMETDLISLFGRMCRDLEPIPVTNSFYTV